MKKRYIIIFFVISLIFILGCDVPSNPLAGNGNKEDKPTTDLFEFEKDLGDLLIKILIRPGKNRISVNKDISLGLEVENKGIDNVDFTYSIVDTPSDSYGGIQRGELSGSYSLGSGEKELVDSLIFQYRTSQLRQTQFLLNLNYKGKTEFVSTGNICVKDLVDEDIGITCNPETIEKGGSSNSAVKISRVEKFLVDTDFDGRMDELIFKVTPSIDSDCILDLEENPDLVKLETLDAAGITGFQCDYNMKGKNFDCSSSTSLSQDFIEGPLNIVMVYTCEVQLSTGSISLT